MLEMDWIALKASQEGARTSECRALHAVRMRGVDAFWCSSGLGRNPGRARVHADVNAGCCPNTSPGAGAGARLDACATDVCLAKCGSFAKRMTPACARAACIR
jgi:hypothetical protein